MPNASIARTTASTALMNYALNAPKTSLLTLMTSRALRIVEMATLPTKKQVDASPVMKLVHCALVLR